MAHTKSLLLGIAIGAGAALGIREVLRRPRALSHPAYWHSDHIELEPEDSRTETHVPNVDRELPATTPTASQYSTEGAPEGMPTMSDETSGTKPRRKRSAKGTKKNVQAERQAAGGETLGAPAGGVGRTQTETESELRRTGTDPNIVSYTRPSEPPTTSGGKAPFTKDE